MEAAARDHRHRQRRLHPHHRRAAREGASPAFLQKLYDDGHIYAGEYEGYYCVGCEEYKQLDDLMETADGDYAGQLVCKIHSRPVEVLKEKNYFFRMSDFERAPARPLRVAPRLRAARERAQRDHPVRASRASTTCRSRGRASTGASRCRGTTSHVVYVWFDALLNYVTAVGYGAGRRRTSSAAGPPPTSSAKTSRASTPSSGRPCSWPPGCRCRTRVFGHGWLLVGGEKMSQVEAHRHRAAADHRHVRRPTRSATTSCARSPSARTARSAGRTCRARYQAELANGFGNLASRVVAMVARYFDGVVPAAADYREADLAIQKTVADAAAAADAHRALRDQRGASPRSGRSSTSSTATSPTRSRGCSRRTRRRRASASAPCSYTASEGLARSPCCSRPVIPKATAKLWAALGAADGSASARRAADVAPRATWGQLPGAADGHRRWSGAVPAHRGARASPGRVTSSEP